MHIVDNFNYCHLLCVAHFCAGSCSSSGPPAVGELSLSVLREVDAQARKSERVHGRSPGSGNNDEPGRPGRCCK